jgi:phospholipid-binding lipoprotein MlaA
MPGRRFVLLIALVLLGLLPAAAASARSLPTQLSDQIARAAEQGRLHEAALGDIIDDRRRTANRQLETAVVAAISENPELFGEIMIEAHRQAPESRASLDATIATMFPGFAGALPGPGEAPPRDAQRREGASPAARDLPAVDARAQVLPGVPSPEERPQNWPVLPKEGGVDGYADIDPLEGLNKVFFYFNGALDFLIFEPLARGYRFVTPEGARVAIGRAFDNLASPIIFANDLLQFRFHHAATTFSRFAINSTVGLLGLFDVAAELGLERHDADFGQTLYGYGVGDGIYLVLPLLGPTTVRDAIGTGVDGLFDPRNWLLGPVERLPLFVGEGMVRREEVIEAVDFMVENSDNIYDAVRAWTYQQRRIELAGECPHKTRIVCKP